ncbi:MAG: hypothetical protein C5B60_11930 [Chloroflexi bacterium]|nr:MAG: hypothetical protein C5B60_11930 [Chloroflexota bacterium]
MSFATQYQPLLKDVFVQLVQDDLAKGNDAETRARHYCQSGKPDFVVAYLMTSDLPDDEKRTVLAESYERRAAITLERAREFDTRFHREFPLLLTSAADDRSAARKIRAGMSVRPSKTRDSNEDPSSSH